MHPPCPRAPRASAAPSPLSSAHQGSLFRWENINSLNQTQKELEPRASGRFLVAVPGSSRGKSDHKAPRPNRDRVGATARSTANPAAPSAPPPRRRHSPLPASRRWAGGRRLRGAEVGGWGSPYRPDSVCVLLSTFAAAPVPRNNITPPKLPAKQHPDINPILSSNTESRPRTSSLSLRS